MSALGQAQRQPPVERPFNRPENRRMPRRAVAAWPVRRAAARCALPEATSGRCGVEEGGRRTRSLGRPLRVAMAMMSASCARAADPAVSAVFTVLSQCLLPRLPGKRTSRTQCSAVDASEHGVPRLRRDRDVHLADAGGDATSTSGAACRWQCRGEGARRNDLFESF